MPQKYPLPARKNPMIFYQFDLKSKNGVDLHLLLLYYSKPRYVHRNMQTIYFFALSTADIKEKVLSGYCLAIYVFLGGLFSPGDEKSRLFAVSLWIIFLVLPGSLCWFVFVLSVSVVWLVFVCDSVARTTCRHIYYTTHLQLHLLPFPYQISSPKDQF